MYTGFAEVYDQLMNDVNYDTWADFYVRMMNAFGIREGKICECACGTGGLTLPLYRRGFHVTGVDLSQDMLWIAAQKARSAGVAIPFVRQDMRQLHLHRPMDAVLATCDGVNYLTTEGDVRAFLRAAYTALLPGGRLCFDCSSRHKLEGVMGDSFFGEERDGIATLWQNRLNRQTHVITMDVTFFVREEDGRYRRFREEHRQRAHSEAELFGWLREAGFEDVRACGEMRCDAPRADDLRIHYIARRHAAH